MTGQTMVIGIGNASRGDDVVGLQVARLVANKSRNIRVIELDYPSDALNAWAPEDTVVIIDAVNTGGNPGEIHVIDVVADKLPAGNWSGGGDHALGLTAVVELARALDKMPRKLVVVGIEATRFDQGSSITDAVAAAVPGAAVAVLAAAGGRKKKR
jgi:hydrogenase maturation protease